MNTRIKLAADAKFLVSAVLKYVEWDYTRYPHMLLFGSTGSGKTYLLKMILGRIGKYIPDAKLIICDYKADTDFSFLNGSTNFYRFTDCINGLESALHLLEERQHGNPDRHFVCLVFDEWASMLNSLDKKSADHAKQMLSVLLMLGRSFNIHVIISQQRPDANYFNNARDNFSVICAMGYLSKESIQMMFHDFKEQIKPDKPRGQGSIVIGEHFFDMVVPKVYDTSLMHKYIRKACDSSSSSNSR